MVKSAQENETGIGPVSALELCLRLARAHAVLSRRLDNALGNLHGLSFGDFMVLFHLHRAAGTHLRRIDLAERLGMTASGVTRTLLPMEKLGLVARQPDPCDARAGYAVLTKAGQRLLANASVSAESISREATHMVHGKELAALSLILGQLAGVTSTNA